MKKRIFALICCVFFTYPALAVKDTKLACPDFPFFRPHMGPLALLNCDFHHEYETQVNEMIQTFGAPNGRPVILNLGGTLVLKYNGASQTVDITPDAYQEVKVFGHTFFALILALSKAHSEDLNAQIQDYLHSLQLNLQQAIQLIPSLKIAPKGRQVLSQLAAITNSFLQELLLKKRYSPKRLHDYIRQAKPLVFEITVIASKIELDALDAAINPWLAVMKTEDKAKIAIVVAASHQAVDSELSVQYFIKKFGAHYRVGSVPEDGLVILQDAFDEESALKLLARHYLDRDLSTIIFNDPTFLQRDVLSEAGRALL